MGRPRKRKNARLPPYVYCAKGRFFYRQYLGRVDGRIRWGKEIRLADADASIEAVWAAYSALESDATPGQLGWLAEQYFASPQFQRLKRKTKTLYQDYWATISETKTSNGPFSGAHLSSITPGVIREYLDRRATVPHQANKERSFLSGLFSFAVERDWMPSNPAAKTKPFPVASRDRYVTDEEYSVIYNLSLPYVQDAMELSYLCRARLGEVLALKKADIEEAGIRLTREKGSKTQIIGWTDRLLLAANSSADRHPDVSSPWIVHDKTGSRIKSDTLQSTWGRKMRKALSDGLLEKRFTFHDLKAKGVSDFDGDKFKASGHRSPSMLAVYDRKIEIVKGTR